MSAVIHSVNAASGGGVPKSPVASAMLHYGGLEGDKQNDLRYHGGPQRAVCLYSFENIRGLQAEGHPIDVGTTGENLTIEGLDWGTLEIGMEISVGEALIELTNLTPPCNTIIDSFSDKRSNRIFEEKYPSWSRWYAKVLTEGIVEAGDIVTIL